MLFRPVFLQIHMRFLNQKAERSTAITNQSIFTNKPEVLKLRKQSKIT